MTLTPAPGYSPAKPASRRQSVGRPSPLSATTIPNLRPSASLPASPVLRSPSPGQTPVQSPTLAASPGPAVIEGPIPRLAVKDPNTLSSEQYVMHKNMENLFDLLQQTNAGMLRMAEKQQFKANTGPKVGQYTQEESEVAGKIVANYGGLVSKTIKAYGTDLKKEGQQITGNAGEKMYKQAAAFIKKLIKASPLDVNSDPVDDNAEPDVSGLKELLDQFSETAGRVFYQAMVKLYVPTVQAKSRTKKAAGTDGATNDNDNDPAEGTILLLTTTEPFMSVFKDRYNGYMAAGEGPTKKVYKAKASVLNQAKPFITEWEEEVQQEQDDMMVDTVGDMSVEDPSKEVLGYLKSLEENDLVRVWKILGGSEEAPEGSPTAQRSGRGGRGGRGSRGDRGGGDAGASSAGAKRNREGESDDDSDPPSTKKSPTKKTRGNDDK